MRIFLASGPPTPSSAGRPLPARLDDSGDFARERQLPETDTTQTELSQEAPRPAAAFAAAVIAHGVFLFRCFLRNCRSTCHSSLLLLLASGPPSGSLRYAASVSYTHLTLPTSD